jgi:hypothetical protein
LENANALSISDGSKPSEAKPALPAPPVPLFDETAPSEDIYFDASDKKTPSEDLPNPTSAPVTSSAVVPAAVPTQTEGVPPFPSTPEEKAFSLATDVMAGIEKHGILCKQIIDMIPTINTAYGADVAAVQSKISSMKDAQGSCEAALLGWEALRCEFRAMRAAAPGIIIETKLFPGENYLFLDVSGQYKFLELAHLKISELLEKLRKDRN